MNDKNILSVKGLNKTFTSKSRRVNAVSNVSFDLKYGETLALVGESGCGKTTTGKLILRLIEADSGEILFKGRDLRSLNKKALREIRSDIQIVFQDPYGSLSPRMTVGKLISEIVNSNKKLSKDEIRKRVEEVILSVGLSLEDLDKYPHQFSGGQRQRIGIGRSIASHPDLIVCDEPVSALDLLVQAQILNLLKDLQEQHGFSYIFISHDLSVVKHMSDRIAIMYHGEIVEIGTSDEIFNNAKHPYTQSLLNSVLSIESGQSFNEEDFQALSSETFSSDNKSISMKKLSDTHYVRCAMEY